MHSNNTIVVTIITVTKNCGETLQRTLDSVSAVKSSLVEYVVVDGLSTDCTFSVLMKNIYLIDKYVSEPDTGIYNAMNKGVRLAKGKFLLFLNGDDEIVEDGFSDSLSALRNRVPHFYCGASLIVSEDGVGKNKMNSNPRRLPYGNSIPHPSAFIPREYLLKNTYREDMRIASDYYLFLNAYIRNEKFEVSSMIVSKHYRGGASGDVNVSEMEVDLIRKELVPIRFYARQLKNFIRNLL